MTDLVTTARTARERLAVGLNELQNPTLPPSLQTAAEPIAQAMSALHQIERTGAVPIGKTGPTVLDLVRQALARLQTDPSNHPSQIAAMEAVAGSLGLVFGLVQRISSAPPPPSPSVAQQVVASPAVAAAPRVAPTQSVPSSPQLARTSPGTTKGTSRSPASQAPASLGRTKASQPPVSQAQAPASPQPQSTMVSSSSIPAANAAKPKGHGAASTKTAATASSSTKPAAVPLGVADSQLQRVAAELGAHSASNFYKGLGGNDVVDSGGIFVATYQVLPVGRNLLIRVSLPGGYEFEAKGVVRWTREASAGDEMSPGYGAQFTEISPEARQLVYRYARNREPLFHDDL